MCNVTPRTRAAMTADLRKLRPAAAAATSIDNRRTTVHSMSSAELSPLGHQGRNASEFK